MPEADSIIATKAKQAAYSLGAVVMVNSKAALLGRMLANGTGAILGRKEKLIVFFGNTEIQSETRAPNVSKSTLLFPGPMTPELPATLLRTKSYRLTSRVWPCDLSIALGTFHGGIISHPLPPTTTPIPIPL